MTILHSFKDDDKKGRFANIRMDNGDPCWVSIAQTGILVKKSKLGLMGAKLFEEKNVHESVKTAMALSEQYPEDLTPDGMTNVVFKAVVNAVLHCKTLAEVTRVLNSVGQQKEALQSGSETSKSFKDSLLELSNHLRKKEGFPDSSDMEDAVTITLTQIVTEVQRKSGLVAVEGQIGSSELVVSAAFMCLAGSPLIFNLKEEGIELSFNTVIAKAASAVFQFIEPERKIKIVEAGMDQYKSIIKSGGSLDNVREFIENVNKAVWLYVMTQDERMLDALHGLFGSLLGARQD